MVVANHDAFALYAEFSDFSPFNRFSVFIDDLRLPAEPGDADGADLVDMIHAQVDTTRATGFRQAVIGVILMVGEVMQPSLDQTGRDWLCTDVHQSPLRQRVVGKTESSRVQRCQKILRPRHE